MKFKEYILSYPSEITKDETSLDAFLDDLTFELNVKGIERFFSYEKADELPVFKIYFRNPSDEEKIYLFY